MDQSINIAAMRTRSAALMADISDIASDIRSATAALKSLTDDHQKLLAEVRAIDALVAQLVGQTADTKKAQPSTFAAAIQASRAMDAVSRPVNISTTRTRTRPKRARPTHNPKPLSTMAEDALKAAGSRGLSLDELSRRLLSFGAKSKSKKFSTVVYQAIHNKPEITFDRATKRYTARKP